MLRTEIESLLEDCEKRVVAWCGMSEIVADAKQMILAVFDHKDMRTGQLTEQQFEMALRSTTIHLQRRYSRPHWPEQRGRPRKYNFHTMQVGETRMIEARQQNVPVEVMRSAVSRIAKRENMLLRTHVRQEDGAFMIYRQR